MPDGLKVSVSGLAGLKEALEKVRTATSGKLLVRAAQAGALPVQNAAKQKSPKRTRTLSRSIHIEVLLEEETQAEVTVGTDVEYAAMQEFGGTITPKNAKYLAIPLTKAAEAVSPRSFPGKLRPVMNGQSGVLVDDGGAAQYALKKSVTIPAHPYLRPALDENVEAVKDSMARALRQQLEKLG